MLQLEWEELDYRIAIGCNGGSRDILHPKVNRLGQSLATMKVGLSLTLPAILDLTEPRHA